MPSCPQEARRVLNAEYQHIVYNEFLPALLGHQYMENFGLLPLTDGFSNDYRDDFVSQAVQNWNDPHESVVSHLTGSAGHKRIFDGWIPRWPHLNSSHDRIVQHREPKTPGDLNFPVICRENALINMFSAEKPTTHGLFLQCGHSP